VEGADAGGEVIQTGEVLEVAAVTTTQDVTQVIEAVDGLFDGSEGAGRRALADRWQKGRRPGLCERGGCSPTLVALTR
jgi:hypothetical protein